MCVLLVTNLTAQNTSEISLNNFKHLEIDKDPYTCVDDKIYREIGQLVVKSRNYNAIDSSLSKCMLYNIDLTTTSESLLVTTNTKDSVNKELVEGLKVELNKSLNETRTVKKYGMVATGLALVLGFLIGR